MIPKTLSASSIQVADLCLKRWEAEYFNRSRGTGNDAANLGTVCHSALEDYVRNCYMDRKSEASPTLEYLLGLYYTYFIAFFGTQEHEFYQDGIEMLKTWHGRHDIDSVAKVLSVEDKLSFDIPTSIGPIQFNYIFDRFDQVEERVFRVVDYKTIRLGYQPEELHRKVQPRTYALAAAILLKSRGIPYDFIKVEFDLLRHDRIGTRFTHNDNLATWASLIRVAETIIETPEGKAPASLNAECNYCPIKAKCHEIQKSINLGGAIGMTTEQLIDIRAQLDNQRKAVASGITEIDNLLMVRAREADELAFETAVNKMTVAVSSRREVDADLVERVVGSDMFTRYGGRSITMGSYDKLLKDPTLTEQQVIQLRSLVSKRFGEPKIKVESRGFAP